jgi:hypothetical protein
VTGCVAASYGEVVTAAEELLQGLSDQEQQALFGTRTVRIYRPLA